jgi:broad specificity phosphatase PhoE
MVRLLFIRHAESAGNFADETTASKIRQGTVQGSDFMKEVFGPLDKFEEKFDTESFDFPLTALGHEQAAQLGEFYAPLLESKAKEGKLHLWVSPQVRTMQTAAPLYSRLHKATGIKARARTLLHEWDPPYHMNTLAVYLKAGELRHELQKEGEKSALQIAEEVDNFFQSHSSLFIPTGMTPEQMRRDFAWCEPPPELADNERPFGNFEPRSDALKRARRNADWIIEMQHKLGDDEILVVVSHGAIMGMTLRQLLQVPDTLPQRIQLTDIPNSCVHILNLPNPNTDGPFGRPMVDVCLEAFGSTDHLGPNRITEFLAHRSGTSLRDGERPSAWIQARGGVGGRLPSTKARL